jgi:hypothetical protein
MEFLDLTVHDLKCSPAYFKQIHVTRILFSNRSSSLKMKDTVFPGEKCNSFGIWTIFIE